MGIADDIKRIYRESNVVGKFILVNISVFLAVNILLLIGTLTQTHFFDVYWLAAPSDIGGLLKKPWTILTYMFLHEGFWHLLWNMVILYFGGRIFYDLLGTRRFVNTYIIGGLFGLFLFVFFYNVFPVFENQLGAPILGASASIMAVFVGIAAYTPNYTVFLPLIGGVRLKYIAIFYVAFDLISIRSGVNAGGHIAHLGGALWGFVWARQLKSGTDISTWLDYVIAVFKSFIPQKNKMKVVHKKSGGSSKPRTASEKSEEAIIDDILDKISKSGYDSLSAKEKEILFKASKK